MSLSSGLRINRRAWTTLPMPEEVVSQIHRMARRSRAKKSLLFQNRANHDLDVLYPPNDIDEDAPDPPGTVIAGVDDDADDNAADSDYNPEEENEDSSNDDYSSNDDDDGDYSSNNEDDEHYSSNHDDDRNDGDDEIAGVASEGTPAIPGVIPQLACRASTRGLAIALAQVAYIGIRF